MDKTHMGVGTVIPSPAPYASTAPERRQSGGRGSRNAVFPIFSGLNVLGTSSPSWTSPNEEPAWNNK